MKEISPAELRARLDQDGPRPLLLDVREPWEDEICRLEGARLVPMARLPQVFGELDPAQETVVYCHLGLKSAEVTKWLERSGFRDVKNLAGGLDAWAREVDRDMPTY